MGKTPKYGHEWHRKQVAVILADGDLDSIQDWCPDSAQHVKDLRKVGYKTRVILCHNWAAAQARADKIEASR